MKHRSAVLLLFLLVASALNARVLRLELTERHPVLEGKRFGLAGEYEVITGKAYFAVDPKSTANATITDLELAPRNSAGEVEFAADFHMIRPRDLRKGNGSVLLEINNRGGKGMLGFFNGAQGGTNPLSEKQFGDGFLLEQGYTLLWVGWQFDVPEEAGRMRSYVPVAKNPDGSAITGLVRANIIVTDTAFSHSLADREHIPYQAAEPGSASNVLTVRETPASAPITIPREKWRFARWEDGKAVTDGGSLYLEGGFQPNKIYDLVYVAKDPPVSGLGLAAVRDVISHLKYDEDATLGTSPGLLNRAYGFGISQSGRVLRTFLYYGLNADESKRRVFDGILAHVAGGGRGSFNLRFSQPSRDGHPFMNFHYPTDIFPFTNTVQKDPETGLEDGILARYRGKEEFLPKIFYTNSAYEYWGRAASQIHTTLDAKLDLDPGPNTRIYQFAGTQHGTGAWPPQRTIGQQYANPNNIRPGMRALLLAMDAWVRDGVEPPASRYGRVTTKTLVRPEDLAFPAIPGVSVEPVKHSSATQQAYRADYGPRFTGEGIVDKEPPVLGKPFPLLVPQVDADGNEVTGIRLPDVTVPLATYTGWNLFNEKNGPTTILSNMVGSYIPFPRTRAEAQHRHDPRKSIEERYRSREEYLGKVAEACRELVGDRLMLPQDVLGVLDRAATQWNWIWEGLPASVPSASGQAGSN